MDNPSDDSDDSDLRTKRVVRWLFRNRQTGKITIAQFPNLALWSYLATVVLRRAVTDGTGLRTIIDWLGIAALAWWALDEVIRGVNPWRRFLGLGGLVFVLSGIVSLVN